MKSFDDYCEECGREIGLLPEDCSCHEDEETSLETLANWQSEELRSM